MNDLRVVVIEATMCLACALFSGCSSSTRAEAARPSHLVELASWMQGSFTSAEQSASDPEHFLDIHLHMTRIWPQRTDGIWLYVEQAAASALDRPYRQRVYRLTADSGDAYRSTVYEFVGDPLIHAGAWQHEAPLTDLTPTDLVERDGCTITLHRTREGAFVGSTDGSACPSSLRGAAYATSDVTVTADELRSWDRGFDAAGTQVWGATEGPYIFKKRAD